jgi:hypothetical protein
MTIILRAVLYRCETVSHFEGETYARVFENRVLMKTLGPKTDEVTGDWRKLHNKELYDLYSAQTIIWLIKTRMRWAGHVAHMCHMPCPSHAIACRDLRGETEGKDTAWRTYM